MKQDPDFGKKIPKKILESLHRSASSFGRMETQGEVPTWCENKTPI